MADTEIKSDLVYDHAEMRWPDPTGNYVDDCLSGRTFARAVRNRIRQTGDHPLLGNLVQQHGAEWSGVQVGFYQFLAECTERAD